MLETPMDVLKRYPVRKKGKQKQAFRDAVESYARSLGYETAVENGRFGVKNLIVGDPESAEVLITAHYDTCAALPMPNLLTPCNFLPFLGYQILLTALLLSPCLLLLALGSLIPACSEVFRILIYPVLLLELVLMYVGPANGKNANDNTSGVVTLLEIARTMPKNQRSKVCFVLFDLEEAGLLGSAAYRKAHKAATNRQIVLNLDCVGDGDHIRLFPSKKLKKDPKKRSSLYKVCGYFGKKDILTVEEGFAFYPSDQKHFPWGVGICALRSSKYGLYLGRIHTGRDTVLEETNVNLLRAALTTYITQIS